MKLRIFLIILALTFIPSCCKAWESGSFDNSGDGSWKNYGGFDVDSHTNDSRVRIGIDGYSWELYNSSGFLVESGIVGDFWNNIHDSTMYEDNLEDGSTSDWSIHYNDNDADTGLDSEYGIGNYGLRIDGADWVETNSFNTSSYEDVVVSGYLDCWSMDDSSEDCEIDFYDGSSWHTIISYHNEQSNFSFRVPQKWLGSDNRIRLNLVGGNGGGDSGLIDEVEIKSEGTDIRAFDNSGNQLEFSKRINLFRKTGSVLIKIPGGTTGVNLAYNNPNASVSDYNKLAIYMESFEDGDDSDWFYHWNDNDPKTGITGHNPSNDINPKGEYGLQQVGDDWIDTRFNTAEYSNLTFTGYLDCKHLASDENCHIDYYDGGSWHTIVNFHNEDGRFSYDIPNSWLGSDNRIRLNLVSGNGGGDYMAVDNLAIGKSYNGKITSANFETDYSKPTSYTDSHFDNSGGEGYRNYAGFNFNSLLNRTQLRLEIDNSTWRLYNSTDSMVGKNTVDDFWNSIHIKEYQPLFEEAFEDGDDSDWTYTLNTNDSDTGITSSDCLGDYGLRIDGDDWVRSPGINTTAYERIQVSGYVNCWSMDDSGEDCVVDWHDGKNWQEIARFHNEEGNFTTQIPRNWINNNNYVRIYISGDNGGGDHAVLDNVTVKLIDEAEIKDIRAFDSHNNQINYELGRFNQTLNYANIFIKALSGTEGIYLAYNNPSASLTEYRENYFPKKDEFDHPYFDYFEDGMNPFYEIEDSDCPDRTGIINNSTIESWGGTCKGDYALSVVGDDWIETQYYDSEDSVITVISGYFDCWSMDDSGENCRIDFYDGSSWQTILTYHNEAGHFDYVIPYQWKNPNNKIRVIIEGDNGCGDFAVLDNLTVKSYHNPFQLITSSYEHGSFGNPGVKNLHNVTYLADQIKWVWENPTGTFDHNEIYIDREFKTNVTGESYTATDLKRVTNYTISVRAVYEGGSLGSWNNHTARTSLYESELDDPKNNTWLEFRVENRAGINLDHAYVIVNMTTSPFSLDCQTDSAGYCRMEVPKGSNLKYSVYRPDYMTVSGTASVNETSSLKNVTIYGSAEKDEEATYTFNYTEDKVTDSKVNKEAMRNQFIGTALPLGVVLVFFGLLMSILTIANQTVRRFLKGGLRWF